MIDEVYIAKRVEYSAPHGQLLGLTVENEPASTVLPFMISAVLSRTKDVVALYPVSRLTAEKLNEAFSEVVHRLERIGFGVLTVITDNLAVNRRFFSKFLSGGELKTSVPNPATGQQMFLLIDPVHNIKNVYNCWQRRRIFQFPQSEDISWNSAKFE